MIVWKLTQPNSFILFIHGVRFFQLIKEYANKHGHFNVGKVNLKQKKGRPTAAVSYDVAFRIIIPKWNMYSLCGLTKKKGQNE